MKTLYKFYLILLFPISASSQINTFYSAENHPLFNDYSDSIISFDSDTTQHLSVNSRLFSIGSVSKSDYSNTHLFGASLSSNLRDKIIFTSHFDYLIGNHNTLINKYQDSLLVFPGFATEKSRLQYNLRYYPNKFITVDFGKGKHFIGNGYRSLMLSTEHSPYPYLKFTTQFGRVRYYNLYGEQIDKPRDICIRVVGIREPELIIVKE